MDSSLQNSRYSASVRNMLCYPSVAEVEVHNLANCMRNLRIRHNGLIYRQKVSLSLQIPCTHMATTASAKLVPLSILV